MRALRVTLTVLACAALFVPPEASGRRLPFRHYRTVDGLPQSQVLSLLQDSRDVLWVGTWSGAARFDGVQFHHLTKRAGLPSNFIFDLAEDGAQNVWLAAGAGLARVAADDPSRVASTIDPLFTHSDGNWVRDLYTDSQGRIWAAGRYGGVARIDGGEVHYFSSPALVADAGNVLAEGEQGEMLIATEEGLHVLAAGSSRPWREAPGPWNQPFMLLFPNPDGTFLCGGVEGLWQITADGEAEELLADGASIRRARGATIKADGELWIATREGLYQQRDAEILRLGLDDGLASELIYTVLGDREDNLWIGSDGGLTINPGDLFEIYEPTEGLEAAGIWSLAQTSAGRLLVGSDGGVFERDGSRFRPLSTPNPLVGKVIRSISEGEPGELWFGTLNDGLFRWDGVTWDSYGAPDFPANRIYNIFRDRDGGMWFATRDGVIARRGDSFVSWGHNNGLPARLVWKIGQDPEGRIVAATELGLARLEAGRFVMPPEFARFAGTSVTTFAFFRDGSLWVGTDGEGVHQLQAGVWQTFYAKEGRTSREGPANDFAWGLLEDAGGRLWLATNHGIDIYDGEHWQNISQREGLIEEEITLNTALTTDDGATWFGFSGHGGLVRFPPQLAILPTYQPRVFLTAVETEHQRYAEPRSALQLPWQERDLTFSFVGIAFRNARYVRYRTFLEGYDKGFSAPTAERSVRYTNLPPGPYRFRVQATAGDGQWSDSASPLDIDIEPPFWQALWFLALVALTILAAGFGLHKLRLWRIESEKRQLEQRVRQRTEELTQEKRKLEAAILKVKTLSGLLPICASCKMVRDDGGYWQQIEEYICAHSEAEFSHGLCPGCMRKLYPDLYGSEEELAANTPS